MTAANRPQKKRKTRGPKADKKDKPKKKDWPKDWPEAKECAKQLGRKVNQGDVNKAGLVLAAADLAPDMAAVGRMMDACKLSLPETAELAVLVTSEEYLAQFSDPDPDEILRVLT